jgi:hypothetical protein
VPGLDITDEDLASDEEATRALYENWCKVYNRERDHEETTRRFPTFKAVATHLRTQDDETAQLGVFADGPDPEEGADLETLSFWKMFR